MASIAFLLGCTGCAVEQPAPYYYDSGYPGPYVDTYPWYSGAELGVGIGPGWGGYGPGNYGGGWGRGGGGDFGHGRR